MSKTPFGEEACCLQSADGLTYIKIGPHQNIVGMMHLEEVFQQLYALDRQPNEVRAEELIGMVRKFNYIAHKPAIEADYAVVLRQAYAVFFDTQTLKDKSEQE
ncbi:MAG: hypothetical protein MUO67_25665 [Anaerolineales bacterium]|nr:hypothetical protein [Anaerolineales bacterium]